MGDAGTMIVKDSSANKASVCCSNYEIVTSMLLSKDEFMDIKKRSSSRMCSQNSEKLVINSAKFFAKPQ